jgi:hypothetical protein
MGGFLAADGVPPLPLIGVIILGTLATKPLGCVVNDLWDWIFIHKSIRTRNRPLAARALSIKVGLIIALIAFFVRRNFSFISEFPEFLPMFSRRSLDYLLSSRQAFFSRTPIGSFSRLGFCCFNLLECRHQVVK